MNEYFENALENESNGNGNSLPEDSDHTTSGSKQVKAPETPVEETNSSRKYGELTGSDDCKPIPVTHDFLTSPTTIDESTNAVTDPHEEFHDNGRVSNSAITVNQATIGNGDNHSGTIPTNSFNNNILFGPELQKALFNNGEASADPKLPDSENTSGLLPGGTQSAQATPIIAEEQVTAPTTPQPPPANPPRLVNIAMAGPPISPHRYDGPVSHNNMPPKPDTPLADQLRAGFWDQHRREMQLLAAYKIAFKAWYLFTTTDSNQTKPDYSSTSEHLKTSAITAQVAWSEQHISLKNWKAANPAVGPIIANMQTDANAIKAGEKQDAERDDFIKELTGKSEAYWQREIAKYDKFSYLIKQSREREMWRARVEALVNSQAIIEEGACRQAAAAAKAERERAEAEARAQVAAAEREKTESEAEEQRKAAEAKAAEEMRLHEELVVAMAAQAAEDERMKEEARAAEAQREAQRLADQKLICEALGIPEDPQLHNSVMCDWDGNLIDGVAAAEAAVFPNNTNSGIAGAFQMHSSNAQDVQF